MSTLTNLQPTEYYASAGYDPTQNYLRELWLLCHGRGFSYAVFDGHQKSIQLYAHFEVADFYLVSPDTLNTFLEGIDTFLGDFKIVRVMFESSQYTLMPAALFEESDSEACYALKYTLTETEQLLNQRVPDFGAQIIYAVPRFMWHALISRFTDSSLREQVKVMHHAYALLSSLYYQTNHLNREVCYVNMGMETFDVVLLKNSALLLCNTYTYRNPEDVLYFVMHAYQSYQLNTETHECMLSGWHPAIAQIRELLLTYVRHVQGVHLNGLQPQAVNPSNLFLLQHCV